MSNISYSKWSVRTGLKKTLNTRGYRERGGGSRTQATGKNSHMPPTQHRTTSAISVIYITMQPLNHTHTTEELQQLPQWGKFLLNDHDQRHDLAMTLWMRALSFAGNLSSAQSNFWTSSCRHVQLKLSYFDRFMSIASRYDSRNFTDLIWELEFSWPYSIYYQHSLKHYLIH